MKRTSLALFVAAIFLLSCQSKTSRKVFRPELLGSRIISVDINRDTTFKTKHGFLIRIPKGSLKTSNGSIVHLVIKEAANIRDIVKAGLLTQHNGQILGSAGMIFINAVGDTGVKISRGISIAIPTQILQDSMRLFRGELNTDSNINWTNPKPISDNPQLIALQTGKSLFMNNCSSCHAIEKKITGPDLAHIVKRSKPIPYGEEGYEQNGHNLLYEFTRSNQAILKWSLYYRCLYNQYNKTPMNAFPSLTDKDLNNLYGYIENESERLNLPVRDNGIEKCLDSCLLYAEAKTRLKQWKANMERDSIALANGDRDTTALKVDTAKPVVTAVSPDTSFPLPDEIDPIKDKPLFYQFTIQEFGWYNIDMLLKNFEGSVQTKLLVKLTTENKNGFNVYLLIPAMNVFAEASSLDIEGKMYGFNSAGETLHLPQNTKAYILALGDQQDTMLFAKKEFIANTSQEMGLSPVLVSKKVINEEIRTLTLMKAVIQVAIKKPSKPFNETIKTIQTAESLKPKNCDCSCFIVQAEDTIPAIPPKDALPARIKTNHSKSKLSPTKTQTSKGKNVKSGGPVKVSSTRKAKTTSPKKKSTRK